VFTPSVAPGQRSACAVVNIVHSSIIRVLSLANMVANFVVEIARIFCLLPSGFCLLDCLLKSLVRPAHRV